MPKSDLFILGPVLAALLSLLFLGGYALGVGRADAHALAANQRADSLATVLNLQTEITDQALEANRLAVAEVEALQDRVAAPKARVRAAATAPVPDTCRTIVETILADADTVFVADSAALALLTYQNAQVGRRLALANGWLQDAEQELRRQADRTERAPRKLLGILPLPTLTAGIGGTLAGGRIHAGPAVALGWSVKL